MNRLFPIVALVVACNTATSETTVDMLNGDTEVIAAVDLAPEVVPEQATLTLPDYPWWDNNGLAVDVGRLETMATDWCAVADDADDLAAFYFGVMPEQEIAHICEADADVAAALGHMYLSGYYGGLWFRDNADLMGGGDGEGHGEGGPVQETDFAPIADNAVQLAQWSATGSDAEVLAHNAEALLGPPGSDLMESMMDALLTLFGYNYGYVKAIFDTPPAGADKSGLSLPCKGYLDCPVEGTALAVYADYAVALDKLSSPPDDEWENWAAEVEKSQGWSAIGEGLWSDGSIDADAWRTLVIINLVYLKATAVAAQASLLAAADGDAAIGRCALLLEAATDTWNRAYFLALRSDAPVGTMPGIACQ